MAFSFTAGPMVRIRFPPAVSQQLGPDGLLDLEVPDDEEPPALHGCRRTARTRLLQEFVRINSGGTGSGFSRRIDLIVAVISNRSWVSSGMPSSRESVRLPI